MRTTAPIAVALAVAMAGSAHAAAPAQTETTHRTLHFSGAGPRVLEVRTFGGVIKIEGYDGADVDMTIDKSILADTAVLLQEAQTDVVLEIADEGATVGAIARYPHGEACGQQIPGQQHEWPHYEVRYDFTIRVPRDIRLVLCTLNRGDVFVKGVRGNFTVHSANGRIELLEMAGSGEAMTANGGITATFVSAPGGDSTFRTVNGDVVLRVPEPFAADLNLKTFTGGLFTDFDSQPRAMAAAAAPQRKNGKFVYEINEFATVRIGRGGPLLTLDTLNGDVRVLRRAR